MSSKQQPPVITTALRKSMIHVPEIIEKESSGISVYGKLIKSIVFSTDVAIIKNCNADAIIAVYPFTPNPAITQAIFSVAEVPVFCGIGGGITAGIRSANVALHAEFQGAAGVVLNAPTTIETIELVAKTVDIPIVLTVASNNTNIQEKLDAGVQILNVSGGANTAKIVANIRKNYPNVPIIATGGSAPEHIEETIHAGANSITYTPPTNGELFRELMEKYRKAENK